MSAVMQREAITETYYDVQRLVYHTARRFHDQYGGDISELISEAHEHFMDAYRKYDPTRSSFTTYVRMYVFQNLKETLRTKLTRQNRCRQMHVSVDLMHLPVFDPDKLNVSDRAMKVIRLVLDLPPKLRACLILQRGEQPHHIRKGLRDVLSGMGWSKKQIEESFEEIRRAL